VTWPDFCGATRNATNSNAPTVSTAPPSAATRMTAPSFTSRSTSFAVKLSSTTAASAANGSEMKTSGRTLCPLAAVARWGGLSTDTT
jgi:hypothetical protein